MTDLPQLDGWVPIHIHWRPAGPVVDWCYLGTERFVDPFFAQTIQIALRKPFQLLFRHETPIDALEAWRAVRPGLPPAGFVFHM